MKIQICTGKNCKSRFSEYILKRLESDIEMFQLKNIDVQTSPCMWHCEKWPNMKIDGKITHYNDPIKASKLMMEKNKQKPKK